GVGVPPVECRQQGALAASHVPPDDERSIVRTLGKRVDERVSLGVAAQHTGRTVSSEAGGGVKTPSGNFSRVGVSTGSRQLRFTAWCGFPARGMAKSLSSEEVTPARYRRAGSRRARAGRGGRA